MVWEMYRTANPLLRLRSVSRAVDSDIPVPATVRGVVRRAWVLALLVVLSVLIPLQRAVVQRFSAEVLFVLGLGIVMVYGAMILVRRRAAPVASSMCAFGIGLTIGGLSAYVIREAGGLIGLALLATIASLIAAIWTCGLHVDSPRSTRFLCVHMAIASLFVLVAAAAIVQPFVERVSTSSGSVLVACVIVASVIGSSTACYVADLRRIEDGLATPAPRALEWYCAIGMIFTVLWLPVEMLRMVTKAHVWARRGAEPGAASDS